jgi:hypothetical protein
MLVLRSKCSHRCSFRASERRWGGWRWIEQWWPWAKPGQSGLDLKAALHRAKPRGSAYKSKRRQQRVPENAVKLCKHDTAGVTVLPRCFPETRVPDETPWLSVQSIWVSYTATGVLPCARAAHMEIHVSSSLKTSRAYKCQYISKHNQSINQSMTSAKIP